MSVGPSSWPQVKLGDVLCHVARPLTVEVDGTYREIGIRSHGKGLFHKAPVTGAAIGEKRVFYVELGDFVLNVVFAWEGAIGVVSQAERGMIASHRFPCFRAVEGRVDLRYLERFFHTPAGLELLGRVSPGGAGRNRTLNRTSFMQQEIPLPPLFEQQRIVARIDALATEIMQGSKLRNLASQETVALDASALDGLMPSAVPIVPLDSLVADDRRLAYGVLVPGVHDEQGVALVRVQDLVLAPAAAQPTRRISVDVDRQFARTRLIGDEVLIAVVGSIGKVGIASPAWKGANIARAVCRIAPGNRVSREYLAAVLSASRTQNYFREATRTLAQPTLNVAQLAQTPIPVPNLAEQARVVAQLGRLQSEIGELKRAQARTRTELDALLPAILDRAFSGEL